MVGKIAGLRSIAEAAHHEALLAADPDEAVHRHFRIKDGVLRVGDVDYFLAQFKRVFVIGAGKASVRMAQSLERILGPRLEGGLVITSRGQKPHLKKILVREGSHPLPDQDSVSATEDLLEFVDPLTDQDLVVCALSGGGSALMEAPIEGVSITDLQRVNRILLASGMTIHEINTVRKRLSRVKGGKLAERIFPATLINLILSDVIGDRLDIIASGPTTPDVGSAAEAVDVLTRRGVIDQLPESVRAVLLAQQERDGISLVRPRPDIFNRVNQQIIGSNRLSVAAAELRARRMGMNTMILSSSVSGESREIAHFYAAIAREIRNHESPIKPPACVIAGGETTVTIKGQGRGGRCQELALAAAIELYQIPGAVFLAAGTDGVDGPTDAAGAIADSSTMARSRKLKLDPEQLLADNDSYKFFRELGDLIITGPSGTNVMDVHILLVG
jgi:glycerate 2-kinase